MQSLYRFILFLRPAATVVPSAGVIVSKSSAILIIIREWSGVYHCFYFNKAKGSQHLIV